MFGRDNIYLLCHKFQLKLKSNDEYTQQKDIINKKLRNERE